MFNVVDVTYEQTGQSTNTNDMGMRAMQARAYNSCNSQYLLLKAPPASGKSRALMFLALDKLHKQGVKKAIVAVPERSIGSSFATTKLSQYGFFTDWEPKPENNLCTAGGEQSKVKRFKAFMAGNDEILICTHATLRFAFQELDDAVFNDTILAIDEFHHVSADADNVLGDVLHSIMSNTNAHIVAMTGSYFRGDSVPVLKPEDEAKFDKVSFNYYEQLNGYRYLKSLGIGYHFYQGPYTSAIGEVLDTNKKTIIHIPSVNSGESTKDKYDEVDAIIDVMGEFKGKDEKTGVISVERNDGKIIKVADLVEEHERDNIQAYLRDMSQLDDIDIILALGMAKEGFDWEYCEHALTVGYRGSLTEVVQIIGRCTRDSSNKSHAQFTNLIAAPKAADDQVNYAVNNMLKAITSSLLMEQVLAPNFKFRTKKDEDGKGGSKGEGGSDIGGKTIKIGGFKEPSTQRVKDILESDLVDLKAAVLQDDKVTIGSAGKVDPEVVNKELIPKVIQTKYPDLSPQEVEEIRQHVVADSVVSTAEVKEEGGKKLIKMANKFVNLEDLHIDLIDQVNPFQKAFEVLSKSINKNMLKLVQEAIESTRIQMDLEEAKILWPKVKAFVQEKGHEPDINSPDALERRLAECLIYIRKQRREQGQ